MFRSRHHSRRRHQKVLAIQAGDVQTLEPRALPTGTVTVGLVGGGVVVTGDNNDNNISIDVTSDGISITGHANTKVKVGATVHAAEEVVSLTGSAFVSGDLKLALKGGDDVCIVNVSEVDLQIGKTLNVDLSEGDDDFELNLSSDASLNVSGDVRISTGNGDDTLDVSAEGEVSLGKNLNIDTGSDRDSVSLELNDLTLVGLASIKTGNGEDEISAEFNGETHLQKNLNIDTGNESDSLNLTIASSFVVSGVATINTGNCDDTVIIANPGTALEFRSHLRIDTGNGSDSVSVEGIGGSLSVDGDLRISTGNDSDDVTLNEQLDVDGEFNISTGNGSDEVNLNFAVESLLEIEPDNEIGKNLKIDTGGGSDEVNVTASGSLEVEGEFNVSTGSGSDDVTIHADADVTVGKDLKIDTGLNGDHVEILAVAGSIMVTGNFTVNLGNEDDCLTAGTQFGVTSVLDLPPLGTEEVNFTVGNDVKVTGSSGDDVIAIVSLDVGRDVAIDLGAGDDVILVAQVGVGRDLKLLGGSEHDDLAALDVTVTGKTTVDAGSGDDQVVVTDLFLGGNADVKLGAGNDELGAGTVDVAAGSTIKLDGGTGIDTFDSATVFDIGVATLLGFDSDLLDLLDDVDEAGIQAAIMLAIEACLDLDLEI